MVSGRGGRVVDSLEVRPDTVSSDRRDEIIPEKGTIQVDVEGAYVRSTPSVNGIILYTERKSSLLTYTGYTERGDALDGNSKWFYLKEKGFIWSGSVSKYDPARQLSLRSETQQIILKNKHMSQRDIQIKVGDTLTFVNDEVDITHNIYSLSPGNEFDLQTLAPGKQVSIALTNPGIVNLECAIHPEEKLNVTVTSGRTIQRTEVHWFKEGYYLDLLDVRVISTNLIRSDGAMKVDVCYVNPETKQCTVGDIATGTITKEKPLTFTHQGWHYKLTLVSIGYAGYNPFKKAAFVYLERE